MGPPSLISNGHPCRVPGEDRVQCEVYYSPLTGAIFVQSPRHKEVRTIRIIAVGFRNLDCRRGVWLASVIGRSLCEEMSHVNSEVRGWVDVWQKEKFVSLQGTDHYF